MTLYKEVNAHYNTTIVVGVAIAGQQLNDQININLMVSGNHNTDYSYRPKISTDHELERCWLNV